MSKPNKAYYKREEKVEETKRSPKAIPERVSYVVEEGDIIIQNGIYRGHRVSELWNSEDPRARDYIMVKIWSQRDLQANAIINRMCFYD